MVTSRKEKQSKNRECSINWKHQQKIILCEVQLSLSFWFVRRRLKEGVSDKILTFDFVAENKKGKKQKEADKTKTTF